MILAQDLKYGDALPLMTLLDEFSRLLEGYRRAIIANVH